MKHVALHILAACIAASLSLPVLADPHKDGSGHGRHSHGHGHGHGHSKHKRGEYREEYRDGHCKVERKFDKKGGYKEERKCHGHAGPAPYHGPVSAPAPPPPGVYVQPPSVVIQPPTMVIR